MFCCVAKPPVLIDSHPSYTGAGVLFVEGLVALAGIQKHFKLSKPDAIARLSGFGGCRDPTDIDWCYTAWREVVEELFDVKPVPSTLVQTLRTHITRRVVTESNGYVQIRCTFADLTQVLKLCRSLPSALYPSMPKTLDDLLLKRSPIPTCEIGTLALLPITHDLMVDPDFMSDLAAMRPSRTA
jgi:hypothetical protein